MMGSCLVLAGAAVVLLAGCAAHKPMRTVEGALVGGGGGVVAGEMAAGPVGAAAGAVVGAGAGAYVGAKTATPRQQRAMTAKHRFLYFIPVFK